MKTKSEEQEKNSFLSLINSNSETIEIQSNFLF